MAPARKWAGSPARGGLLVALVVSCVLAAPSLAAERKDTVKLRLQQQTQQHEKKTIIDRTRQGTSTLRPTEARETESRLMGNRARNQGRYDEAQRIYLNLRSDQGLPHDEAVRVLDAAGYPTDRLVDQP